MSESSKSEKDTLRVAMRARRSRVDTASARAAGARAAGLLVAHFDAAGRPPRKAALYASFDGELDTGPLDEALRARGVIVAYPRVVTARSAAGAGALAFHAATPDALARDRFGIAAPSVSAPRIEAAELDLVVVPGLAFDARGGRCGFGGGYYDALLAAAPSALRCGLAFPFQLVGEVPQEPHDERLDLIVHDELIVTHARPCSARPARAPAAPSKEETP